MTIEDQAPDSLRQDSGYGPELKRTLGSFQVFAISFAFISVAVGIFGTYDDVLQNSGPVGHLALGDRGGGADAGRPGGRPVRRPHRAQRLVLPVGLAAGQPEDRLGVRLADLLLSGDRRGGCRQRAGEPGLHAALRHGAGRGHRAGDHAGGAGPAGHPRHRLDPHRRHDQLGRRRPGTDDRRGVGGRPDRRGARSPATARSTTSSRRASPRTPRSTSPSAAG